MPTFMYLMPNLVSVHHHGVYQRILETELQVWLQEGQNESAEGGIDVYVRVDVKLVSEHLQNLADLRDRIDTAHVGRAGGEDEQEARMPPSAQSANPFFNHRRVELAILVGGEFLQDVRVGVVILRVEQTFEMFLDAVVCQERGEHDDTLRGSGRWNRAELVSAQPEAVIVARRAAHTDVAVHIFFGV